MLCPFCSHHESRVVDSRDSGRGVRRRRQCIGCSLRFTTYETVQTRALLVVKRDERREEFDRDKLLDSVTKACAKRPLPIGAVDKVVQEIEAELAEGGRAEVPSRRIGGMVMDRLKKLDRVAYIRFASVYRDFRDIETFKEEIDSLLEPAESPTEPHNQLSFLVDLVDKEPPAAGRRRGRPRKQPQPE
jgi:transcriptional repressor NrdR